MCIKVISNLSFEYRNSYSVTKAVVNFLKIPNLQRNKRSVIGYVPSILSRNLSTQMEFESKINDKRGKENKSADQIVHKSSEPKTKYRRQASAEVLDYMNSKNLLKSMLNELPQKILKRKRGTAEAIYVIDKDVANTIVKEIIYDSKNRNTPVFEINPGPGILSRELLAAGVQNLSLCEPSESFLQHMENLETEYPSQVQIIKQDLLSLGKLTYQDRQDGGTRVQKIFSNVPKVEWTDKPVMRVIGVLPSLMFIRHLMKCHIFQTGIMSYGRPEFYVILSPSHHFYLTCGREAGYFNYRSISVLFQLIFDWSLIKKLPREAFLPWEVKYCPKKWSKLTKVQNIDPDLIYLVKIVPRRDFFEKIVKVDQLQAFWYFVWHHMVSRKNKVIPQLEKWIPHCGPRLVMKGMTIYTEFGDLTPEEILAIFHEFVSWPEYPDCPFTSSIEGMLMKMEQGPDEIVKIEGDEDDDDDDDVKHIEDDETIS